MRRNIIFVTAALFLCASCGRDMIAEKPRSECAEKTFSAGAAVSGSDVNLTLSDSRRFKDVRSISVRLDRVLVKRGINDDERRLINEIEKVLSRRGFAVSESSEPDEFELESANVKKSGFDAELVIDTVHVGTVSYTETLEFLKGEYAVYTYPYYRAEISGCIKNAQGSIIWRDAASFTSFDIFKKEHVPALIKISAQKNHVYSRKLSAWKPCPWNFTVTDTFSSVYNCEAKALLHCRALASYTAEEFLREVTQ